MNSDEQVRNQLKEKLGKAALKTKDELISVVHSKLRSPQNMPEVVKGFSDYITPATPVGSASRNDC